MAITDSTLKAGARAPYRFWKPSMTTEGAGTWQSLWKANGNPIAGATPPAASAGSGYVPTRSTTGAVGQVNAAGGNELRAVSLSARGTVAGSLVIYDRLWACSGLGTVSTSTQNVTTPGTLTSGRLRSTGDFTDVEMWLEVYTAPGATTATWTVVATDGGGGSRSYTYTHPANAETVGQMMPLVVPSGAAAGVQQVTSFTASASSGTTGDIGVTLLRPIAEIDLALINTASFRGALDLALANVAGDACIAFMVQCTATTSGLIAGLLGLSEVTP